MSLAAGNARTSWFAVAGVTLALLAFAAGCATSLPKATAPQGTTAEAPSVSGTPTPRATTADTPRPTPSATPAPTPEPIVGTELGQRAPEFQLSTTEGAPLSLSDLRGRPVWIVFWAPGCPSCTVEMGMMETMYQKRRASGLEIVGIAVSTTAGDAAAFGTAVGITYPLAVDTSTAAGDATAVDYGVFLLPTHFFLDRDGVVRGFAVGDAPPDAFEERLDRISDSEQES